MLKIRMALAAIVLTLFSNAYAQQTIGGPLTLGCEHLFFIQQRYIIDHVNFKDFGSNLEARVVDQFIKQLDSSKMYLLDKDVRQIKKNMKGIFGKVKARQCSSIISSYKLFSKRVAERVKFVKSALSKDFKLNKNTQLVLDSKSRKYAKTVNKQNAFHRKYLDFQIGTHVANDTKVSEAREKVVSSYERISRRIKARKDDDLFALYLEAFARGLDPHSSFFSADQLEDFKIQMSLSLEGIGATLSSKDGFTVVEQLIAGGAAARNGKLKPKDKIIAVAQAKDKDKFSKSVNVIEMDLRDVVQKIRGPKGTKVKLSLLRKEGKENKRIEVVLVRDKIKLEDEAVSINYIDRTINGEKKKVALVNLPSFYADSSKPNGRSAATDLKKALRKVKKKKADAIVLDLSTNGGGSLDDAVKIAGLFFKTGNVVKQSQKDSSKGEVPLADKDPAVDWEGPLVVLQSRISASASEIVAGTLKDYKRAVIVGGDHTFGKGTVQSVRYLPRGLGAWKTTVGMFFTAGGASTQHRGVDADIVFPSAFSTDEIGEKNLDYSLPPKKLKSFLSKDAYVKGGPGAWKIVDQKTVNFLNKNAMSRVKKNKDFTDIAKELKKAEKRGKVVKVTELFEQEKDEKKDGKKKKDEDESAVLTKAEKTKKYLERADVQEAINIALDLEQFQSRPQITIGRKDEVSKKAPN